MVNIKCNNIINILCKVEMARKTILSSTLVLIVCASIQARDIRHASVLKSEEKTNIILSTDTSRVIDIDEVVVVSQPKELFKLRRQPLSSSVISNKQFNDLGVNDLRSLSAYVPSFVMPEYGSRLTSAVYVRGIGSRINNPAIAIYSDGVPVLSKAAFNMHFYQIDRVDVLRGPQGTIYGQNTEGGLVKIYTRNPFAYQGTDINLSVGSHFYRNAEVAHYHKFVDKAALSVAAFYNGQNGFLRNTCLNSRADKIDEGGARIRLMLRPSTRTSFDIFAEYQHSSQNGFAYGQFDPNTDDVQNPSTNYQGFYKRDLVNTGMNFCYRLNGAEIHSTTTWQYLRDNMLMDQDYVDTDYMHLAQRQTHNALAEEISIKSTKRGAWHHTSGIFTSYQWLKTWAPVYFGEGITSPIANVVKRAMNSAIVESMTKRFIAQGMGEEQAKAQAQQIITAGGGISLNASMCVPATFHTPQFNLGIFHESTINLTERLMLTLGLRYDLNSVDVNYDTQALMQIDATVMGTEQTRVLTSSLANAHHTTYNQLLPKIGISYTFDQTGSNIYAQVSKGYRAGGYNIQMFSDILQTELTRNSQKLMQGSYDIEHTDADYEQVSKTIAYKPEVSWNYELGTHVNLFDGRMHADLAAFYMQVSNQQLSVMASNYGFGRMMVNAGKSESYGIEATVQGAAWNNRLDWTLSYALTHATFRSYTDSIKNGNTYTPIDYKGKRVPFVPMHTLGAAVNINVPIASGVVKMLRFGVNSSAQGNIYWDEANTCKQRMYALLGAHADASLGFATISFWGKNLTNTRFNTFVISSSATGEKKYFAQRGNPIQLGVDVKLHF